jgi:hypothetical protein
MGVSENGVPLNPLGESSFSLLKVAFWGYTPISERPIFRAAQV